MAIQHIALFSFKPGTGAGTIDEVLQRLRQLSRDIPGISAFSAGANNSPEGLSQGLTHGFVMTFRDAAARDAYLPHPKHEAFKEFALPHLADVVVFDYDDNV